MPRKGADRHRGRVHELLLAHKLVQLLDRHGWEWEQTKNEACPNGYKPSFAFKRGMLGLDRELGREAAVTRETYDRQRLWP